MLLRLTLCLSIVFLLFNCKKEEDLPVEEDFTITIYPEGEVDNEKQSYFYFTNLEGELITDIIDYNSLLSEGSVTFDIPKESVIEAEVYAVHATTFLTGTSKGRYTENGIDTVHYSSKNYSSTINYNPVVLGGFPMQFHVGQTKLNLDYSLNNSRVSSNQRAFATAIRKSIIYPKSYHLEVPNMSEDAGWYVEIEDLKEFDEENNVLTLLTYFENFKEQRDEKFPIANLNVIDNEEKEIAYIYYASFEEDTVHLKSEQLSEVYQTFHWYDHDYSEYYIELGYPDRSNNLITLKSFVGINSEDKIDKMRMPNLIHNLGPTRMNVRYIETNNDGKVYTRRSISKRLLLIPSNLERIDQNHLNIKNISIFDDYAAMDASEVTMSAYYDRKELNTNEINEFAFNRLSIYMERTPSLLVNRQIHLPLNIPLELQNKNEYFNESNLNRKVFSIEYAESYYDSDSKYSERITVVKQNSVLK